MDRIHILTTSLEKYHLGLRAKITELSGGLGARDTLRTEMGYPLWGNDIDLDTPPDSAGLLLAVDTSGHDCRGRIASQDRVGDKLLLGCVAYLPETDDKIRSVQVDVRGKLHTAEIAGRPIFRFGGVNG